jgi:hypothetical protein
MFDEQLFHSWPAVLAGASCFAALFAVAVTLGEFLFDGTWQMTRSAAVLGVLAFSGYVAVTWMIRSEKTSSEDAK